MNFFETQREIKKITKRFIFIYPLLVIAACSIFASSLWFIVYKFGHSSSDAMLDITKSSFHVWFTTPFLASLGIILYRYYECRFDSWDFDKLTYNLNLKRLDNPQDIKEQQVLNVTTEMSIASGLPVPQIHLMQQDSINAFSFAESIHEGHIVLTTSALKYLTRDELQALVAKQIAVIGSGEVNLTLSLYAYVESFLYLKENAMTILEKDYVEFHIKVLGLPIMFLIYCIGLFFSMFAKVLNFQVQSLRKKLMDSYALQYTRYFDGLVGILKKNMVRSEGSYVKGWRVYGLNSLFFDDPMHAVTRAHYKLSNKKTKREIRVQELLKLDLPYKMSDIEYKEIEKSLVEVVEKSILDEKTQKVLEIFNRIPVMILPLFKQMTQDEDLVKYEEFINQYLCLDFVQKNNISLIDYIALLEQLIPYLQRMSRDQKTKIYSLIVNKINQDNKFDDLELLSLSYVYPVFEDILDKIPTINNQMIMEAYDMVLSFFYYLDEDNISEELQTKMSRELIPKEKINNSEVLQALRVLRQAEMSVIEKVVKRCESIVIHNDRILESEKAYLIMLKQILGVPGNA